MQIHREAELGNVEALVRELDNGAVVDARDHEGLTPLMFAVSSDKSNVETVRLLLERGADSNAVGGENSETVLMHAVGFGDPARVELLLDAGADIAFTDEDGYDVLIHVMYGRDISSDANLMPLVNLLIRRGAPLGGQSDYGDSALSAAFDKGRLDVVALLLEAGSDISLLGWDELFRAVGLGTVGDVKCALASGADLLGRDYQNRTPWLLSLAVGDINKARALLDAGADRNDVGHCGKTALVYPIEGGHIEMLRWLLAEGFPVDAPDEFGHTALNEAVSRYNNLEAARLLMEAGASLSDNHFRNIVRYAWSPEMARVLIEHGAEWSEVVADVRAKIFGLDPEGQPDVSREEYESGKHRRFGTSNPEPMTIPFWNAMIRCGWSAYGARKMFDDTDLPDSEWIPVWCYDRFGKSTTELPDGRFIEIGGEHEDSYDPNFCIYNEVVVFHGGGQFQVFGYPREVFPPTDFHSATLVDGFIYIIGCLGCPDQRIEGHTPVFRLNLDTFAIERLETSGDNPGWIYKHRAVLVENEIHVSGYQIGTDVPDEEELERRRERLDRLSNWLDAQNFDEETGEELDDAAQPDEEVGEELDEAQSDEDFSLDDWLAEDDEEENAEAVPVFALNLDSLVWRRLD